MKSTVSHELAEEGYIIHLEPWNPPLERLTWSCYRPDILGVKDREFRLKVALAECETNPSISRIRNKNTQVRRIVLQALLGETCELRLILAIPCGMLSRANHTPIRRLWEIWAINKNGRIIYKVT
ncbi:MAG: hypothetical protein JSW61_01955 [Candidatus Thorarchaeota archaeon]|nr:MAG: hypothetical protein JSW61_01955 [Candidatus Thorarchaeota archaeon]